jgi:N-acetylmuramoyl-L-alanine amidase
VPTRHSDRGVGPCVDQRAAIGNRAHATVALSIHADGGPPGGRGFHVIEPGYHRGSPVDAVLRPSDRLARDLLAAVRADTGTRPADYLGGGRGLVARTDLAGLMLSTVPKVFVETANMRNPVDAALCRSPAFRQRVARAVVDAVRRFVHPGGAG